MIRIIKNKLSSFFKVFLIYPLKYKSSLFKSVVFHELKKSKGSLIEKNVVFHKWSKSLKFGDFIYIGENTFIDNCSKIGSFSSISMNVKLGLDDHNLSTIGTSTYFFRKDKKWVISDNFKLKAPLVIDEDVLVSANAVVLSGLRLNVGCVIAAGAVVVSDVPPYAIVGGVPAKIIGYRFEEDVRNKLSESKWWKENPNKIKSLNRFFNDPLRFLKEIQNK